MTPAFLSALTLAPAVRVVPRKPIWHPSRVAACITQPSPPLQNRATVQVNKQTGKRSKSASDQTVAITQGEIELPTGLVHDLDVTTSRAARAAVWGLSPVLSAKADIASDAWLAGARVVVFAHGFSQRPANYASTLRRLALLGYVVLAPRVWLLSVVWPWVTVETAPTGLFNVPGKLQTALLIDTARCAQLAGACGAAETHLLGHSMGGCMALAYLPYTPLGSVLSAAVLAPAVSASQKTELNPFAYGKDPENFATLASAMPPVPLLLLQGKSDKIVSPGSTEAVAAALKQRVGALTGLGLLDRGTHIGFEDRLDVDVDIPLVDVVLSVVFLLIDLIAYGPGDVLDLDTKEQLETSKELLETWFAAAGNLPNDTVIGKVDSTPVEQNVNLSWSTEVVRINSM